MALAAKQVPGLNGSCEGTQSASPANGRRAADKGRRNDRRRVQCRVLLPDFATRLSDDTCLVVETKGQEDLDVALKDRRARRWCQDATRLAGREWAYAKVPQKLFDTFDGDSVEGLRRFLDASGTATN